MDYKRVSRYQSTSGNVSYNGPYGCPRAKTAENCMNEGISKANREQGKPLAMVYAPYQYFENIYTIENGFYAGTIFADLDLPCTACTSCRIRK